MKLVLQRVDKASVSVGDEIVGKINRGFVVFLGIGKDDNKDKIDKIVNKISKLRIFADENGKTNLSSKDVVGEILVVSQFTLMADCSSNRPSFSNAGSQDLAKELYNYFVEICKDKFSKVQTGQFAAHMHVKVDNDGPFTLFFEE